MKFTILIAFKEIFKIISDLPHEYYLMFVFVIMIALFMLPIFFSRF
jgi:hypothetical protein